MRDFTCKQYRLLLQIFLQKEFGVKPFCGFIGDSRKNVIILRHDVDRLPNNSLKTAQIENDLEIRGSYYFRIVSESYNEFVIKQIIELGHEIGYHYEDMTLSHGNMDKAYDSFCENLDKLRKLYPVKTICMHGSPLSKWDSRDIWRKYDYHKLGIIGEPYFDLDFNKTYYITDTGRRWNGHNVSLRDKAMTSNPITNPDFLNRSYHSTFDIIDSIEKGNFPNQVMMTFHPQRWTDNKFLWAKELIVQNLKNQIKRFLVK